MKRTLVGSKTRRVYSSLSIVDLFDGNAFPFDFVIAELRGDHPRTINRRSDKAYYILEGTGHVTVGFDTYDIAPSDLVLIKAGVPHSISGTLKYAIVMSPPFDPHYEDVI
jgi:mannose-6-phosphate isomerase-like protein (cupin superfamily)